MNPEIVPFLDNPKTHAAIGVLAILSNFLNITFHEVFPIITTVGALAGSCLAIHGATRLIINFFKGVKTEAMHFYQDERKD